MYLLRKLLALILRPSYRTLSKRAWKGHSPDRRFFDRQADTRNGPIGLRVYPNEQGEDKPLIVYMHGGGFLIGDLDSHHGCCLDLCQRSGQSVVAIDYRLGPEFPFPTAHDDCLAATQWIMAHTQDLAPAGGGFVLAGDSAGGNLVAATCIGLEDSERAAVKGLLIYYPTVDYGTFGYASYEEKARGYQLTTWLVRYFWESYLLRSTVSRDSEEYRTRATVLHTEGLEQLPATLLVTAEHDPLRDEGKAFAEKLSACGVQLQHRHFDNSEHGFACTAGPQPDYLQLMAEVEPWLQAL